ncbi:MAG: phosphate acyltransferase PlsX [Chloroflexi bacterium]|nr:phosphate acyltransferase PlsX [Chloroflexota bacterium]
MRIAVDAMGSDNFPEPDVAGAVAAARRQDLTILLVGDEKLIQEELTRIKARDLAIEIHHAEDRIRMSDKPGAALKDKPASSIHLGLQLVKEGRADAYVSAGNTGAIMAIATLNKLQRIRGIKRPALSAIYPIEGRPLIILDVGANVDSRPEWLQQFALMGSLYSQTVLGIAEPRVALLSNGEEAGKGSQLIQESEALLRKTPVNFVGNIEPSGLLEDKVDVLVTDGFTGNILLKTFEGTQHFIRNALGRELRRDLISMLGGILSGQAFVRMRRYVDPERIGGAPLLGLRGIVLVSHGSANAVAIQNAILQAGKAVSADIIGAIQGGLQHLISPNQ